MKKLERVKKLSKTLEYERIKRGMTHKEFAELLGIPRSSVTAYIIGNRIPGVKRLRKISKLLSIDIAKLLTED